MCTLIYYLNTAWDVGENRQPSKVVQELGIKYKEWYPAPMADRILLKGVEVVPDNLPSFITVKKES